MKAKGLLTALLVILVPVGIDLQVRTMMIKPVTTDTLSSKFSAAYLQALPFYTAYVLLVLLVLSLYNHNKSKNKSH